MVFRVIIKCYVDSDYHHIAETSSLLQGISQISYTKVSLKAGHFLSSSVNISSSKQNLRHPVNYILCSFCTLIRHPEHLVGRHCVISRQTEGHLFGNPPDQWVSQCYAIERDRSFYCALFYVSMTRVSQFPISLRSEHPLLHVHKHQSQANLTFPFSFCEHSWLLNPLKCRYPLSEPCRRSTCRSNGP
jgi:hypothetical protein